MNLKQVIAFFGNQTNAATALSLSQPTISNWKSRNAIPLAAQLDIEVASHGALKATSKSLNKVISLRIRSLSLL